MNHFLLFIIATTALISYNGFQNAAFFDRYKFQVGAIQRGDRVRMFSSGFLHGDWGHLIFNMLTLYFFAPAVIAYMGSFQFLVLYLLSLLGGNLLTLVLHKNDPYYSAIGASGAVTGILYASILLQPEMNLYLFFIPIPIPAPVFGFAYLLYSIYGMKKQNDGIGHTAHFGGAITGLVLTLINYPSILQTNLWLVGVMLLPIVLLWGMIRSGKL